MKAPGCAPREPGTGLIEGAPRANGYFLGEPKKLLSFNVSSVELSGGESQRSGLPPDWIREASSHLLMRSRRRKGP